MEFKYRLQETPDNGTKRKCKYEYKDEHEFELREGKEGAKQGQKGQFMRPKIIETGAGDA